MTKLDQVFPKDSLYLTYIYAASMILILFDISWYALLFSIVIDTVSFILFRPFEQFIFYRIFPKLNETKNLEFYTSKASLNQHTKLGFINTISSFPMIRSLYSFLMSFLKVLPVGIYIAFTSTRTDSFWKNLATFYVADSFILIFVHSLLFIQLHEMCSKIIADLRFQDGWKEDYWKIRPLSNKKDYFTSIQNTSLASMLLSLLGLCFIITHFENLSRSYYLVLLFSSMLLCIGSIQYHFQNFFKKSLIQTFSYLDQDFTKSEIKTLPLHTSPLLAGFESTVNQLGHNLKIREQEIQEWLKYESEKFHFRSLGEIAALVAHDIKTPLHVMKTSLNIIEDSNASSEHKLKYKKILEKNLDQTIAFTETLMNYLRGKDSDNQTCVFSEIHYDLIDLFETQYHTESFHLIKFEIDSTTANLNLKINRIDSMHIFYNIYQNAIKSVLNNIDKSTPTIRVWHESIDGMLNIFIQDSGVGLDKETFISITEYQRSLQNNQFKRGIGLRVTKTILNHINGKLDLVDSQTGACFKISIPHTQVELLSTELNQNLHQ